MKIRSSFLLYLQQWIAPQSEFQKFQTSTESGRVPSFVFLRRVYSDFRSVVRPFYIMIPLLIPKISWPKALTDIYIWNFNFSSITWQPNNVLLKSVDA